MKFVFVVLAILSLGLGSCAPLVIGAAAGLVVSHHEAVRQARCMRYFGNPYCYPGNGEHHSFFPMGVHK